MSTINAPELLLFYIFSSTEALLSTLQVLVEGHAPYQSLNAAFLHQHLYSKLII